MMDKSEARLVLERWSIFLEEHPDAPFPGRMIVDAYRATHAAGEPEAAERIKAAVQTRADEGDEEYAFILADLQEWTPTP